MQVKGKYTQLVDVEVNVFDVIDSLSSSVLGCKLGDLCIHEDELCYFRDVSYHGSPVLEYTKIKRFESEIQKDIYRNLNELDYLLTKINKKF